MSLHMMAGFAIGAMFGASVCAVVVWVALGKAGSLHKRQKEQLDERK